MTDPLEEFLRSRMRRQTATIRAGDDFRTKAIDRGRQRRRRRRGSTWLGVGVTAVALVIAAGSLAGQSGEDRREPAGPTVRSPSASSDAERDRACPVGEERRVLSVDPRSLVLGCAQLPGGRRVALLNGYREPGTCLQIVGIDNRARQCGFAPSSTEPPQKPHAIAFQGIAQRNKSTPLEIFGTTSDQVTTVELSYPRNGSSHSTRAALIPVTDSETLEVAGIAEPFGYFLAELPADTSHVSATALGPDGQQLGADDLSPYLQSQPRRAMITGPVGWDGSTDR